MKILWHSNAPFAPTGYGQQTGIFAPLIKALLGHEIVLSSYYGLQASAIDWHGITVLPPVSDPWGNDVLQDRFRDEEADLLITLMDAWVLSPDVLKAVNAACWMPVDCEPLSSRDEEILRRSEARPIALSLHGEKMLRDAGFSPFRVPHGIDTLRFRALEESERDWHRASLGLEDRFVIGLNASLKDPFRKGVFEQLSAFRNLHARHPDTALLFHGPLSEPTGVNLPQLVAHLGIDDAMHYADQRNVRSGRLAAMEGYLPLWYNLLDLYTGAAWGEGFGIPVLEALACGVPAVVTDFSSMPEVAGRAAWLVGGQPVWNPVHGSTWVVPSIDELTEAYEQAYQRGTEYAVRKTEARVQALGYDAGTVTTRYWGPVLEQLRPSPPALWDYGEWRDREIRPYGDETTYRMGLGWLAETCKTIEDWGAGLAYGRRFAPEGVTYTAIDSSPSSEPWVDVIADLRDYASPGPDGIFMRHVLEHNLDWEKILANALGSFRKRMVLVIFTPFGRETRPLSAGAILDQSFCKDDLDKMLSPFEVREEHARTDTQFGSEHVYYIERAVT